MQSRKEITFSGCLCAIEIWKWADFLFYGTQISIILEGIVE